MRESSALGLAISTLLFQTCQGPCTLMACAAGVFVKTVDEAGSSVKALRGQWTFNGKTEAFDCSSSTQISFQCEEKGVRFGSDIEPPGPLELQIEGENGLTFQGKVEPTYQTTKDFNGPGCGDCTGGTATVTLTK